MAWADKVQEPAGPVTDLDLPAVAPGHLVVGSNEVRRP